LSDGIFVYLENKILVFKTGIIAYFLFAVFYLQFYCCFIAVLLLFYLKSIILHIPEQN